ncbi:hypothetical protein B0H13DRAFT_2310607 [Mycena leptocephala]|nr:hypothetical protein B0H13DRAFT_2310607 [Mycena leptocephala]
MDSFFVPRSRVRSSVHHEVIATAVDLVHDEVLYIRPESIKVEAMSDLYFIDIPDDALPDWKALFVYADAYMSSPKGLLGRSKSVVRKDRRICLNTMGLTNDFDAYLSAEAGKQWGNEYFRQGKLGRLRANDPTQFLVTTFLNCAAVSLRQKMWGTAEHFCTLALDMENILSPTTKAKAHYRRPVANRLLSHEGRFLQIALADIKLAHELQPQTSEMAKELETIEQMMTLPFPELKRTIQRQRDACEAFNPEYVMTDDDGKVSVVEQRVKYTRDGMVSGLRRRKLNPQVGSLLIRRATRRRLHPASGITIKLTSLPRCALHDICDASEREEGAALQVGPPASTCIRCGKSSFSSVNLDWRLRELMFMNEYPDTPFLTVFDYRRGKAEIKLHQLDTFAHRTGLKLGAEWDNDVARAAQSGGRMALPLFCASEAGRCRYWIVPLRSASATVHEASEGLRRLVACLPRNLGTWNIPELLCQIQNLIDSGGKQIHQETGDFTCQMDPILDFATVPLGSLENHLCCAR